MSSREHLPAYLSYYWPVSFAQTCMVLEELRLRGFEFSGKRALDLGAGPGPGAAALAVAGFSSVDLVDSEAPALAAARRLCGILPGLENTRFIYARRDLERDSALIPTGAEAVPGAGGAATDVSATPFSAAGAEPYDLILACHSVNELWKAAPDAIHRRAEILRTWARHLAPEGLLLVVEPAALVTSRPALALRDTLLGGGQSVAQRATFECVAPCPGSFPCPLLAAGESRTCHSTWTWDPPEFVATLAKAAGLDRDSAKATWFALRKTTREKDSGSLPCDDPAASSGKEPLSSHQLSGRVVSEPMLNKAGRVRYVLCSGSGLATLSAKRGDSGTAAEIFFSLRRGDVIEADNLEPRGEGNSFGILPGTRISRRIIAPRI